MNGFSPSLLLAGPVLRRVTPTSVSVWVATSQPCTVTLDVYGSAAFLTRAASAQTGTVAATKIGTGTRDTIQAGGSLHIAVATAPVAAPPPDTICSYNVTLGVKGPGAAGAGVTGQWDLGGLKLLDAGDPSDDYQGGLGYAEGHLPSFATSPADVASLRLFHGSCFKMHGDGPSILGNIDDILSDALPADATAAKQRPHVMLLTGDQIYADDVATALSPVLTTLGTNLLAGAVPESVPVPGSSDGDIQVSQQNFPAGRRQRLIRATAGMTSDDCDSHLIGFGEIAALYLLCWTGRGTSTLWPATAQLAVLPDNAFNVPAGQQVKVLDPAASASAVDALLTPLFTDPAKKLLGKLHDSFADDRAAVDDVGKDGDKVRRALANIPVLTICDDHEVTDDWFITGAWRQRVLASDLGRAVVRNALVAYVLFQGWGNTPDRFAAAGTPEAQFLDLVPQLFAGAGPLPDRQVCAQLDKLLGLDDPTGGSGEDDPARPGGPARIAFNYSVDLAGARIVVLDTRTHREYGTPNGPPGLLSAAALDIQLPTSLTDNVPLLIVVSPAPVLGPRLIEEIVAPLGTRVLDFYHVAFMDQAAAAEGIAADLPFGDLYLDVESWSARRVAFERFLDRVTRCPQVVILAGDVHYAASFAMDYTRFSVPADEGGVPEPDPQPPVTSSRVVHFTSSAIRNGWKPKIAAFANSIGLAEHLEKTGFEGFTLGWHRMDPPVFGADLASGEARPLRARLKQEPVVLPTAGWGALHQVRSPEWMYQVKPLSDTRTDDIRFQDLAALGFTQVLGPAVADAPAPPPDKATTVSWTQPGGPYTVATELHAANVEGAAVTRTLVFDNNIGVVTFKQPDTGPLTVQMALYFIRPHPVSSDEKPHPYVVHAASLGTTALTAPATVGPAAAAPVSTGPLGGTPGGAGGS